MKNIAYLANYQGDDLIRQRKIDRNRALAGTQKIATVSSLLAAAGCSVSVFSLGAVAERSGRLYPAFESRLPGAAAIPVFYQPEWDIPVLGRIRGVAGLVRSLFKAHRQNPIDAVLMYNCGLPEVVAAWLLTVIRSVPIVLEYEDDVSAGPDGRKSWRQYFHSFGLRILERRLKGVVAVSPELRARFALENGYVLRGVLSGDLAAVEPLREQALPQRLMYAGSLQSSKGVDKLCEAFDAMKLPGCDLHVAGQGPLLEGLRARFGPNPRITFHGFVTREQLIDLFGKASILVNPHQVAGEVGAVFPFKLIEYIGTGRPVISTPMAPLPDPLSRGVLYSKSDSVADLAEAIEHVHGNYSLWCEQAGVSRQAAWQTYGPETVSSALLRVFDRAIGEQKRDPLL